MQQSQSIQFKLKVNNRKIIVRESSAGTFHVRSLIGTENSSETGFVKPGRYL